MSERQLKHSETENHRHSLQIVLVGCSISSPANAGALLRLADAFNIKEVLFYGKPVNLNSNRLKKTARNTEKTVKITQISPEFPLIEKLKKEAYRILGLEITSTSIPVNTFKVQHKKIALILGNEQKGIPEFILKQLDETLHISLYGNNTSINVSHAAAIALYEITKPPIYATGI